MTRPTLTFSCHRMNPMRGILFGRMLRNIFLCLIWGLPFFTATVQAAASGTTAFASPERIKAVYLYKFLNYVDWPSSSFEANDSPYVIGVMGADDVADELSKLSSASNVNHRTMKVKRLQAGDPLNGIHVLFIGQAERRRQQQVMKQLESRPVLLVTETRGALDQGSMINFRIVDDRVRFEVAIDTVEKSGLKLNSRLLSVAIAVVKGTP